MPAGLGHPLSRLPRVQEKVGQIAGLLLVNRSLPSRPPRCAFRHRGQSGESHHHRQRHSGGEYRARADRQSWSQPTKPAGTPLPAMCSADGYIPHRATARLATATSSFNHKDNHDASIIFRPGGGRADAAGAGRLRDSAGAAYLRIADQKAACVRSWRRPTPCKISLTTLSGPSSRPPRLAEALNAGAVDAGIIGDAPLLFATANGAPVKAIAVDKSNPAGTAVLSPAAR